MQATLLGAKIHYELFGRADGKKLCVMHGWGGNTESFLPLIRDLSEEYSILAFDFPGHGASSEPPEPWSVTEYMEATRALLAETGFSGCDIAAHSFGARVAILLAAEYPECAGKMLLTGAAGIPPRKSAEKSKRNAKYQRLKKLADLPVFPAGMRERMHEALIQKFGSADYKALTPTMRPTFNKVITQDLTPCLARIKSPVFLFWGENDTATPLWMGEMMRDTIPDAYLTVAPGCGHFAYVEQYNQFLGIAKALFA